MRRSLVYGYWSASSRRAGPWMEKRKQSMCERKFPIDLTLESTTNFPANTTEICRAMLRSRSREKGHVYVLDMPNFCNLQDNRLSVAQSVSPVRHPI